MASHLVDAHGKKLCQECAAHATAPGSGRLLSRFTTVELLVIASMVAADFGFGLLVKPLLTAMHLTSVVRLDMILPLAMVLLTRLIVFGISFLVAWNLVQLGIDFRHTGEVSLTIKIVYYPIAIGLGACFFIQMLVLAVQILKVFSGGGNE